MNETYAAKTVDGHVVFFARHDGQISVYCPESFSVKNKTISLDGEWADLRTHYAAQPGFDNYVEAIHAAKHVCAMQSQYFQQSDAKPLEVEIGSYFPRVWRGLYDPETYFRYNPIEAWKTYSRVYLGTIVAGSSLFDGLSALFLYLEPSKENLQSFSHKIREALILVCTEVESAWRSVLEANTSSRKVVYSTADYYRVAGPLRLHEWAVMLTRYPELGELSPFAIWDQKQPTKSLPWYDAYNAVKHYREENFQLASLEHLLNASAALHIMQAAQFGPEMHDRMFGNQKSPFFTTKHPIHDISVLYAPDFVGGKDMSPRLYFG